MDHPPHLSQRKLPLKSPVLLGLPKGLNKSCYHPLPPTNHSKRPTNIYNRPKNLTLTQGEPKISRSNQQYFTTYQKNLKLTHNLPLPPRKILPWLTKEHAVTCNHALLVTKMSLPHIFNEKMSQRLITTLKSFSKIQCFCNYFNNAMPLRNV